MRGTLVEYPTLVAKCRRLVETRFEMRKLLALCEPAWFEGLVWNGFGLSRTEGSAMSFWVSVNAALPEEWDVKTMAIRESKDLNKLELHDLFANLKAYEFELETRSGEGPSTSQPTQALAVTDENSQTTAEQISIDAIMFTLEDLVHALNEMVYEYKKLSQIFEDVKSEKECLKDKSDDASCLQLEDSDNIKTELSKRSRSHLMIELDWASALARAALVILLLQPCPVVILFCSYQILRASGNTALSSPCWYLLATMHRVVNYHSSWFGQQQVELLMHLVFWVWCKDERVSQILQLVVVLTQLVVPQEVDRVSQLCILSICTGITTGGMSRCLRREMPPRCRGRGRGQFQDESGGQNEDQRSFPSRGRGRRVEDEVDDLTTRVESMEIVLVGFGPAVGRGAWRSHRICLNVGISSWKDISSSSRNHPLSDRVSCWYFSRCVLVGSSSSASLDFSRLCISTYPAVARVQLLRVISCWYFSGDDQQRELRDSETMTFCEQEPAVGFVSVFCSG
ncbi:hypothetical protein F511_34189 [Dorcoceras hygrometricum]|uniref:Uncharacterized protein n=1 Tax=Dorcoceras hygrometricum TaxID=472368 RepID=A0A2Z7ATD6_9LAMI|nr:hypothetical protein F511_34189 [Dorcoceras hygrometricum]